MNLSYSQLTNQPEEDFTDALESTRTAEGNNLQSPEASNNNRPEFNQPEDFDSALKSTSATPSQNSGESNSAPITSGEKSNVVSAIQDIPIFRNAEFELISNSSNGYVIKASFTDGSQATITLEIFPNILYAVTNEDANISSQIDAPLFDIHTSRKILDKGFEYSASYLIPYSSLSQEAVKALESFPQSNDNSNQATVTTSSFQQSTPLYPYSNLYFLNTVLSNQKHHVKQPTVTLVAKKSLLDFFNSYKIQRMVRLKLHAVYTVLDSISDWSSVVGYGFDWKRRTDELDKLKDCLEQTPRIKSFDQATEQAKFDALEDAKQSVATNLILKGLVTGASILVNPFTMVKIPHLHQKIKMPTTNMGDAISSTGIDQVVDGSGKVFDSDMDNVIKQAKKTISENCIPVFTGKISGSYYEYSHVLSTEKFTVSHEGSLIQKLLWR